MHSFTLILYLQCTAGSEDIPTVHAYALIHKTAVVDNILECCNKTGILDVSEFFLRIQNRKTEGIILCVKRCLDTGIISVLCIQRRCDGAVDCLLYVSVFSADKYIYRRLCCCCLVFLIFEISDRDLCSSGLLRRNDAVCNSCNALIARRVGQCCRIYRNLTFICCSKFS